MEHAAILFTGEIPELALLTLLTHDPILNLQIMPGYERQPARFVVDQLERLQLLHLRREGGGARVFVIHEIIRRKIMERIQDTEGYKDNLLRKIYESCTTGFVEDAGPSSSDDDVLAG
jgi:hypothetical protein